MKKILLFLLAIVISVPLVKAQDRANKVLLKPETGKNVVKLNVFALAFKSVSVQYERQISAHTTLGLTIRMMPKSTLPFKNRFKNVITDPDTKSQVDNFKTGNVAFMPSARIYVSRKGAYHGFYVEPFLSYAHYSADLPYQYQDNGINKTIPLSGSNHAITAGIMLGAQWNLGKSMYLDWWILGPHYGSAKGSISGKQVLSSTEQEALKSYLDDISIPLVTTTNTVDANGAILYFSGSWAGVRSGLCVGVRF